MECPKCGLDVMNVVDVTTMDQDKQRFLCQECGHSWEVEGGSGASCILCKYHQAFYDDGYGSDGCICHHLKGDEYHTGNCLEYTDDFKGCPYREED